ncbi:unnamed protein product [Paramecium sonneborni]|uniref:Uncharacterized protein n=1 Tax=Paramecium sonneborni TaxID=65129 RepID=A0A8S1Q2W2_9CILI|nr:unnamed protein product [Paramecium sonneborni]
MVKLLECNHQNNKKSVLIKVILSLYYYKTQGIYSKQNTWNGLKNQYKFQNMMFGVQFGKIISFLSVVKLNQMDKKLGIGLNYFKILGIDFSDWKLQKWSKKWKVDIIFIELRDLDVKLVNVIFISGGGLYDDFGEKTGRWIELHENFSNYNQISYDGDYKNGIQCGFWSMKCNQNSVGGGNYDIYGIKVGKWVELYNQLLENNQVLFEGEYFKGTRIGFFKIIFENNTIGGGEYNQIGQKVGQWVELDQCFQSDAQVYNLGFYKEDRKYGKWQLQYLKNFIGGGIFDLNGEKNGYWIEINQNFYCDCQLTFQGEYKNNQKRARWNALLNHKIIGGGRYNQNQEKVGNWIELHENYWDEAQIIFKGQYFNGIKRGIWMTIFNNKIIKWGRQFCQQWNENWKMDRFI